MSTIYYIYNAEKYIDLNFESVYLWSHPYNEILILNFYSTDNISAT